jgi:uncharacterized membrane protein YhaH (DUF805 family)
MDQLDFNKLWHNFTDTIAQHYTDFSGRVGRAQYWYFMLVSALVGLAVAIVGSLVLFGSSLQGLYALAMLLPSVGMTARRLQDTGRPGFWAWLLAVPLGFMMIMALFAIITVLTLGLGAILFLLTPILWLATVVAIGILIYFCAQPGTPGANEYGPAPAAWTPHGAPAAPVAPPPAAP